MRITRESARHPDPSDEGSTWLYRDVPAGVWRRVEIVIVPSETSAKVKIQHIEAGTTGGQEWVHARRLRVPWGESAEYLVSLDKWARAESHATPTPIGDAAQLLLGSLVAPEVAEFEGDGCGGVLHVRDLPRLAAASGLTTFEILGHHADAFHENGDLLPWPTVDMLLHRLCARQPAPALELLRSALRRQGEFQRQSDAKGEPWWMRPASDEDVATARRLKQWHDGDISASHALQRWLDAGTPTLSARYAALHRMYAELAEAAREAAPRVRVARSQTADRVADELLRLANRPLPDEAVDGCPTGGRE